MHTFRVPTHSIHDFWQCNGYKLNFPFMYNRYLIRMICVSDEPGMDEWAADWAHGHYQGTSPARLEGNEKSIQGKAWHLISRARFCILSRRVSS